MSDGPRATREPDYVEPDVEPVTYEHCIPLEELENDQEIILQLPEEGEVDPDVPF